MNSFDVCQQITRKSRSNFVIAFRFLPLEKRNALIVLYAYMRFTDDLVDDESVSLSKRQMRLSFWQKAVSNFLRNENVDQTNDSVLLFGLQILPAVFKIVQKYNISAHCLIDVIEGVSNDLKSHFQMNSLEESYRYCDCVATSVGKAILSIFQTTEPLNSPEMIIATQSCGRAFQWTNFLRDIREDVLNDRFYFPLEDFQSIGLTPEEFKRFILEKSPAKNKHFKLPISKSKGFQNRKRITQNEKENVISPNSIPIIQNNKDQAVLIQHFMKIQFQRTESLYNQTEFLINSVHQDSRFVLLFMRTIYYELFRSIKKSPQTVFQQRLRLSFLKKISVFGKTFLLNRKYKTKR